MRGLPIIVLALIVVIRGSPLPPALPKAFAANLTWGKLGGYMEYDYTKLSYRMHLNRTVFGEQAFSEYLYRYDLSPPLEYLKSTLEPNCTKQAPDLPDCIQLAISLQATYVSATDGVEEWQESFLGFKRTWYVSNTTANNNKTSWKLERFVVHTPFFGNLIDWSFSNIIVGLQPASAFDPMPGCPPIVPPVFYKVSGYVRNALSNDPISGLNVYFGDSASNVTDSNGMYSFAKVSGGEVNITAGDNSGYINSTISLNVTSDIPAGTSADIIVSPSQPANSMRAVLTWGFTPQDLDLHAWDGGCEIAYFNPDCADGSLDHDTRTGYGPETITLTLGNGNTDCFHLFVNQFSSDGTLQTSSARVQIYVGNSKTADFTVPTTGGSDEVWWDIGYFNAASGKANAIINQLSSTKPTGSSCQSL